MKRTLFYYVTCIIFGNLVGWLTVNFQWFRLLMAVISGMVVVYVFAFWLGVKMERKS